MNDRNIREYDFGDVCGSDGAEFVVFVEDAGFFWRWGERGESGKGCAFGGCGEEAGEEGRGECVDLFEEVFCAFCRGFGACVARAMGYVRRLLPKRRILHLRYQFFFFFGPLTEEFNQCD